MEDNYVTPYRHGTTTSSLLEIFRSYNSLHNGRYRQGVAATEKKIRVLGNGLWLTLNT